MPNDNVLTDRRVADAVNTLRDIAIRFHDTQQLRERIAEVIVTLLAAHPGQPEPRAEVMDDWIKVDIQRPTEAGIEPDDDVIAWNNDPGFPTIVEASFVSPGFPEYTHWKKKPHGPIDAASAEGSAHDER